MLPDDPSFYEHARHYATVARAIIAYLSARAARQPQALLARDDTLPRDLLARVFPATPTRSTVHLVLRGTNFQIQVWQAMLRTRVGQVLSDTDVAQAVGAPRAQRAGGEHHRLAHPLPPLHPRQWRDLPLPLAAGAQGRGAGLGGRVRRLPEPVTSLGLAPAVDRLSPLAGAQS